VTLGQLLDAAKAGDASAAGRFADHCRFRYGWDYNKIADTVRKMRGIDVATWDELLYEADMQASQ
jgi:hypothetical protein